MISWQVTSFIYVPVNVNCLSAQGPSCPIGHFLATAEVAAQIKDLCKQAGLPLVVDFFGINIPNPRAFEGFAGLAVARPTLFINMTELCLSRLKDDGVPLESETSERVAGRRVFWLGTSREPKLLSDLQSQDEGFIRSYLMLKTTAINAWNKLLPSTPVHATHYYDVKRLCIERNTLQIIAVGLATAVLRKAIKFDLIVASSLTGSLVAAPVSILLGKPFHCWTDLGPAFRPKRRIEWTEGKGKKCLLVADVICMGTEARAAQAFVAALGSQLVGCAAVAIYLSPSDLRCLSLLGRRDLDQMGYKLLIPAMEGKNDSP